MVNSSYMPNLGFLSYSYDLKEALEVHRPVPGHLGVHRPGGRPGERPKRRPDEFMSIELPP